MSFSARAGSLLPFVADRRIVASVLILLGGCLAFLNMYKFIYSMGAGFHDYGKILSAVLNTAAGEIVPMRPGDGAVSHLATHFHLILFPVSWLNRLVPYQHLYGFLMAAGWYAVVVALGLFAFHATRNTGYSVMISAAFFLNLYSRRLFFSGQYEHLQVLFEILAVFAFWKKRWAIFAALMAGAVLVREDVALYAGMLALFLFLSERDRRGRVTALCVFAGCALYFLLTWFYLMPAFLPPGASSWRNSLLHAIWGRGDSLKELLSAIAAHPLDLLKALFRADVLKVLLGFGFLPLLRPGYFSLVCIPPILVLSLSVSPDYFHFRYYNSATFMGLMAVGAVMGLMRIDGLKRVSAGGKKVMAWSALSVALVLGSFDPGRLRQPIDAPWFGLTVKGRPFPVQVRDSEAIRAIGAYPYPGGNAVAGPCSYCHVPRVGPVWFIPLWKAVEPEVIVFDEVRDASETLRLLRMGSLEDFYADLGRSGYKRRRLAEGLFVFTRK